MEIMTSRLMINIYKVVADPMPAPSSTTRSFVDTHLSGDPVFLHIDTSNDSDDSDDFDDFDDRGTPE